MPLVSRRVLLTIVLLIANALPAAADQPAAPPNVVIVLMDDMGYADVGCYGAEDIRTPQIDRLAREGVRLTNFYSNGPVCTPTRCGLMTGRYQQRVGLEWALGVTAEVARDAGGKSQPAKEYKSLGLDTKETCVARMFKDAGFGTAIYGKWHLGYQPQFGPNAHGFDEFFGIHGGNADMYSHQYRDGTPDLYENTKPIVREGYLTELIADRAVDYIDRKAGKQPFFLYVPFNAVHWPFQAPNHPEQRRNYDSWYAGDRAVYAAMLEAVDTAVGRIRTALEQKGSLDNTLFIFTNDNGGEVRLASNKPLFHHKATLWEGGIRVPCILRWPGKLPAGKVSHQVGISMDLTASILAACNIKPSRELDGVDLLPVLKGEKNDFQRTLCWRINRADRKQRAVRHGRWKYVLDGQQPVVSHELLFDLEVDPGERFNLASRNPELMATMRQLLAKWEAEMSESNPETIVR